MANDLNDAEYLSTIAHICDLPIDTVQNLLKAGWLLTVSPPMKWERSKNATTN